MQQEIPRNLFYLSISRVLFFLDFEIWKEFIHTFLNLCSTTREDVPKAIFDNVTPVEIDRCLNDLAGCNETRV